MSKTITIELRLFAMYRERLGAKRLELSIANGQSVADLFAAQVGEADAERLARFTRFAVNERYVGGDTILSDGDRVAFIPPVAGG